MDGGGVRPRNKPGVTGMGCKRILAYARMTRKDAGMTSRGKLAGTNSHKSFRLQ